MRFCFKQYTFFPVSMQRPRVFPWYSGYQGLAGNTSLSLFYVYYKGQKKTKNLPSSHFSPLHCRLHEQAKASFSLSNKQEPPFRHPALFRKTEKKENYMRTCRKVIVFTFIKHNYYKICFFFFSLSSSYLYFLTPKNLTFWLIVYPAFLPAKLVKKLRSLLKSLRSRIALFKKSWLKCSSLKNLLTASTDCINSRKDFKEVKRKERLVPILCGEAKTGFTLSN